MLKGGFPIGEYGHKWKRHCSPNTMRRPNAFRSLAAIAGLSASISLVSCSSDGSGGGGDKVTGKLNGAGASFPAAIYQRWFQELQP